MVSLDSLLYNLPAEYLERMERLLGDDFPLLLESYTQKGYRGLRANTLKCSAEKLEKLLSDYYGQNLHKSPFSKNSFYISESGGSDNSNGGEWKPGTDPLHHAGAYYMQEPSATAVAEILNPVQGEFILDLCASPGGKSTQIACEIMNGNQIDNGFLWSNEYVYARANVLLQNVERCGISNFIVSSCDTGYLCGQLAGCFDAVLVDAPCSGEGMFRKSQSALDDWSLDNIIKCADRQLEILNNAVKALKKGGRIVYSTCTFSIEENEGLICKFLDDNPDFYLDMIEADFGSEGFEINKVSSFLNESLSDYPTHYTRRIFPWQGGEGHFIALLKNKASDPENELLEKNLNRKNIKAEDKKSKKGKKEDKNSFKDFAAFLYESFSLDLSTILDESSFFQKENRVFYGGFNCVPRKHIDNLKGVVSNGLCFAETIKSDFKEAKLTLKQQPKTNLKTVYKPTHGLYMSALSFKKPDTEKEGPLSLKGCLIKNRVDLKLGDSRILKFLKGEDFEIAPDDSLNSHFLGETTKIKSSWCGIFAEDIPLGFGKAVVAPNHETVKIKNHYPKGLRLP